MRLCVESAAKVAEELNIFQSQERLESESDLLQRLGPPLRQSLDGQRDTTQTVVNTQLADLLSYFLENAFKVYGPEKVARLSRAKLGSKPLESMARKHFL